MFRFKNQSRLHQSLKSKSSIITFRDFISERNRHSHFSGTLIGTVLLNKLYSANAMTQIVIILEQAELFESEVIPAII